MKTLLKLTTAAAALAGLSACDMLGLGGNDSAGGNAAANTVAANATDMNSGLAAPGGKDPAVPAATSPGGAVTPAFLTGRWTDNNDCNATIEFRDDGSFVLPGIEHGERPDQRSERGHDHADPRQRHGRPLDSLPLAQPSLP
jgi:hypothetical protein